MGITVENRYIVALETYNKLEVLFKVSQMVQELFHIPVLNEYRYISRALVDYNKANGDEKKHKAISRLEVAISAAYNDILDAIVMTIKFTVSKLRDIYPNVNSSEILLKYKYKEVINAIIEAETIIINSRANRENRLAIYESFSNSESYTALINFSKILQLVEYEFLLSADNTIEQLKINMLETIHKCFNNENNFEYPRFELFYQPKYFYDKRIIGAEALIRIRLSESELISPVAFLDFINEARLVKELDMLVLRSASNTIQDIKQEFPENFEISINVTPSTISDYRYIELFNQIVKKYKIEDILSIEIVETWNHDEDEHVKTHYRLGELNSKTKISIDDFGSGTTMLDYIVMISNLHTIKIDKLLIDKLETKNEEKGLKLISGINKLAKETDLQVIVEGVETEKQFNLLKDIGIKLFQGYYFKKPLELTEFKSLLNSTK